ncbi:sigma factor-like helix-turn-helix DNA-binding protein [Streptomyces asiaticus]
MGDWLIRAWESEVFDERERAVVTLRSEGRTLDEVGAALGLSRERPRQIQNRVRKQLTDMADIVKGGWRDSARAAGAGPAAPRKAFAAALGFVDHVALEELLAAAGLNTPRTWAGPLHGWWSAEPGALDSALRRLVDTAPFRGDDLDRAASEAGLPAGLPLAKLLAHSESRLALSPDGHWVRRKARGRDAAYLWLLEAGRPCQPDELLAPMAATTVAAVREALRRDDRFRRIHPEGTWALTEWTHLRASPYATAVEAMVAVVTESGPLSRAQLFARVTELHPVTPWRLTQCLISDQLGETPDGLVDLVSRGARPIEDEEPAQPDSMAIEGDVIGARIPVTRDVLRGSGINVHTWLTWRLGLRQAPMSRTFTVPGDHQPLIVRRGTSGAQLSSLRRHALELEVDDGCVLAVLLRLDDDTARVGHGCAPDNCPAQPGDSLPRVTRTTIGDILGLQTQRRRSNSHVKLEKFSTP